MAGGMIVVLTLSEGGSLQLDDKLRIVLLLIEN